MVKAPFVRLFIALSAGILLQWWIKIPLAVSSVILLVAFNLLIAFFFFPYRIRYKFRFYTSIPIYLIFISGGALLCYFKDVRNSKHWLGHYTHTASLMIADIREPPVEKPKTYKAIASLSFLKSDNTATNTKGQVLIYFRKDSQFIPRGNLKLIFRKTLEDISNPGNSGGFDYKRYCLFNGITNQVFLNPSEYYLLPAAYSSGTSQLLYNSRNSIVEKIRKYIPGKQEAGLAEALLVGYKNDLDRSIVQSYSNTGVVHIIAISGLHLGLIYWMLLVLLKPIGRSSKLKWIRPLLVIAALWAFSFLAGAQPSVLRAALMFSVLLLGELAGRKSSMFNSLALSAFVLLCINPFWLWDIGFQLSYAAVLSIIMFMRPIYNLFYIKNKWLDLIWKMNAVTIAAQVLTTPLSIYHFHQFPNLFLLSNCIAVPLSTLILFSEIILCLLSAIPFLAIVIGKLTGFLIRLMNHYVEWVDQLPGSVSRGIEIDLAQTVFLYIIISGISAWLLFKRKKGVLISLTALLAFLVRRIT